MSKREPSPVDFLRTYSVQELEHIAKEQLKLLGDELTIPVDIERIVEEMPSVDFDIYPKLKANYNLLGMVGPDESGKILVYVDSDLADSAHSLPRYRMTVAEELAHLLLHRQAIERVTSIDDFKAMHNHRKWYLYERNAKRLAAALLMPAPYILDDSRSWYKKIVSYVGYSKPEIIKKVIKNKLADKYVVSVLSMEYRLSEWPINVMSKIDEAAKHSLDFLD